MAAKLAWHDEVLRLGPFPIGDLENVGGRRSERASWRFNLLDRPSAAPDELLDLMENRWEDVEDARQDIEAEVRRLLKEAGVDL